jgi:hypothetical protein
VEAENKLTPPPSNTRVDYEEFLGQ